MTIDELIERHRLKPNPEMPPPGEKHRMAKADARPTTSNWKRDPFDKDAAAGTPASPLLRSKHYRAPSKAQHFRPQTRPRTPWSTPDDRSHIDKPLNAAVGEPANTKFTDQVRAAAAEVRD